MASNERVGITLDVLPGTFAGVTAALGGFNELVAATSVFSKAIADSTSVIDAMTLTLGVALAGAAWESAKAFGELERGMKIVQAVSGQTSSEISVLTQKANEFSVKYKMGIDDITAGLQTLGRAGLSNVNTQLDTMQAGLQAAKIQGMELNDALEKIVATTALLGGDLKSANFGQQAEKLTSQLLSTAMTAPIDLNDVVQTLSYSGGTAAAAGINIQNDDALYDYLGAISAFAQKGVKGSMAGTAMRAFFTKPASQDTSVVEAFNQLKMKPSDLWEDGGNAMRPVSEQIDIIHKQMEKLNMSTLDQIELWGKIVGPKMGQQMMKLNADTIKATSREIRQTASATELANMTMDNFLSDLATLEQQAQRSWRGYGETALAWISPVVKAISGLFNLLGADVGGIPIFQQFVKMGIIIVISQIIQKLGAVKNLFVGIVREMRNMWGSISKTERTIEEEVAAERKRLQALGLTKDQAQVLADTEGKVVGNLGTSNKVLAEFLAKLNQAVTLMSELATLSRATSMNMISSISSAQHNRLYNNGAKDMSKTAWFNQHRGNTGNLTKNEFAALSLRHGMNESDLLKIYDSKRFQTYAQNKQGSSYAFPTAVSLEKYLQENQKGLYDPKVNPIMGIVNNIKTDTGVIAQGVKTRPSSTKKDNISDTTSESNKKQSGKSSRKAKKEKAEEEQAIEEEKQAKENKEQTIAEEKVTKALKKQEQAAQTCADLMSKEAQQRREAVDKSNASRSQIARQNAEQRIAQLKGEEINGEAKVLTQQTIRLNEQIVESSQHKKMHKMALDSEQTIGNALSKRYITEEEINNIEQQYLALLTNNLRTIKGKSPGYTGQFTLKNIERRKTPYIYGDNQNADAEALASNKQAIARYNSYQNSIQQGQGQLQQTIQNHLNTERMILEEVEEELTTLRAQLGQESKKLQMNRQELAERQEFIALYQMSKAKARAYLEKNQSEWSKNVTSNSTNNKRVQDRNYSLRDTYRDNVRAEDRLIAQIAKEEAKIRQQNLGLEHKIKYLETEKATLLENINFLEQNEANVQKEVITQEEFLQKEATQKKTAHITTLESILGKLVAENDALEQEKNKIFAYSASKQNMINASNIGVSTHIAQNGLLTDINAEYDSFLNKLRANDNKINRNKEQINLVLGAIIQKLNALGASIPASLIPTYAHSNPNTKTSIVPGIGQTMPGSIANTSFWKNPVGTPLLLPAGYTPNWIYGSGSSTMTSLSNLNNMNSSLLLPQTAESFKKVDKNLSTVLATMPYYKPNFSMVGSTYQGGMGSALGMHMGSRQVGLGVSPGNILQLEEIAQTFKSGEKYWKSQAMQMTPAMAAQLSQRPIPSNEAQFLKYGNQMARTPSRGGFYTDTKTMAGLENAINQLNKSQSRLSKPVPWDKIHSSIKTIPSKIENLPSRLSKSLMSTRATTPFQQRIANTSPGFWGSARNAFTTGYAQSGRYIQGGGLRWNWLQMGMTGMVNWGKIREANAGLSTLGKVSNVAGGALGSLGMMFGPAEVAMMGFSLAMQGIQAAQQKYKEELEKINSKLSEARENFEKAEEAFLEAYEKENDGKVTQDQKDEALLNLYANGQGDRGDNLDSYRAKVYGALNQIEINTRKKAAKENDFWWGSQGGMQKSFWSHWDETWGWMFDNKNIAAKDELTEQIRLAQENARTTGENRTTQWTEESVETAEDLERKYQSYIGMGQGTTYQMDYTLSHYANWIEDMEDYTEQAKYSAALLDRDGGIDSTGVTGGAELERTFGDNIAKSYRQFEASLQNIPATVKTQITDSINSDPEFYKSMQRQMFTFKDNKLQRVEGKETKILEAIRRRVGNITTEQAKQTLILSTLSSIHDFVQNQIQPQLMANVESSMSAANTLGMTYVSGGYTGSSTDAVHQGVMIITAQLGSLIEQKTLENMSLMAQSTGINFGDLTALARASETGLTADLRGKGYTEADAGQAMSIMKSMEAMYSGTMVTKGMSQEDAYKYGQTKFEELFSTKNGFAPEIPDMLRTWERWFVPTMAPYIEEKWAQNLQDTTGEASGPTDTGKDKDKSKDSSKDTANKKNWVNLAICNKKEIPKLNVNLFKKPPNFTILNRNFKLRDVNVNTADDAKSIQNAVKNSIIEIQNRSNPKIIQDDAAEYDPVNATEGNTLPTGTKKTE